MKDNKNNRYKINFSITAAQVRLTNDDGTSEIMSIMEARSRAAQAELDLVEVVPNAKPPVCKIIDFGKWRYEETIRKKEDAKKQKSIAPKEIQLRCQTGDHDLETKIRALKKFLLEKRQVKLIVRFRNRELAYVGQGEQILNSMIKAVTDISESSRPKLEGKTLIVNLMPK